MRWVWAILNSLPWLSHQFKCWAQKSGNIRFQYELIWVNVCGENLNTWTLVKLGYLVIFFPSHTIFSFIHLIHMCSNERCLCSCDFKNVLLLFKKCFSVFTMLFLPHFFFGNPRLCCCQDYLGICSIHTTASGIKLRTSGQPWILLSCCIIIPSLSCLGFLTEQWDSPPCLHIDSFFIFSYRFILRFIYRSCKDKNYVLIIPTW